MNDRINCASVAAADALKSNPCWQFLQEVLGSPWFAKAPRMRALLSFLIISKLNGREGTINEYAIGIEVFRRDARDFDTAVDPIVRVQMGRLRARLAHYNAACANAGGQKIDIPPGSYLPLLTPCARSPAGGSAAIQLAPMRKLDCCAEAGQFAEGLEEELAVQMYRRFGGPSLGPLQYRLETSIRIEAERVRASSKLVDIRADRPVWMHQCDREGELLIALQEALANTICNDLQGYLHARRQ